MKKKERKIQQILIVTGLLLFVLTYFYYPLIIEEKLSKKVSIKENIEENIDTNQVNSFTNMEYRGVYNFNKTFKVKSKEAYILNEEPDIVHMTKMHVILKLNNGKIVTSIDLGRSSYNKKNYKFIKGNFLTYKFKNKFDCIYASHVLEHQPSLGIFFKKCIRRSKSTTYKFR